MFQILKPNKNVLGEDGVEELKEDLNASKIMYGFIQVEDPKTSLPKYVFLHWQGESVPGTRKGMWWPRSSIHKIQLFVYIF